MPTPEEQRRLEDLKSRIAAAKEGEERIVHESHYSQAQVAWRMVTELVAGLGIGFGIGYGLDSLLGTTPWLMVLFVFIGLAAGVQTMMRTAKEVEAGQAGQPPAQDEKRTDDGN